MPGYKAHISFACFLYFVIIALFMSIPSWICAVRWLLLVVAGALFPDIDTQSKGRKVYAWTLLAMIVFLIVYAHVYTALFLALLAFVPLMARHRGLLHNVWFIGFLVTIIALSVSVLVPSYRCCIVTDSLFFMVGAFSHLVLDRGIVRALRMRG